MPITRRWLIVANLVALGAVILGIQPWHALAPRWAPSGTPLEIVTAIAERHDHGNRDDHLSPDEMSQVAWAGRVDATCGPVSVWAAQLLRQAGYEARVVTTLTLDPWNSVDNGHTMVSVHEQGSWIVYDVDRGVRYTDPDGVPLGLRRLIARVRTDQYDIVPLAAPVGERMIRASNQRLLQIPGIDADGLYWFPAEGDTARRLESYAPDYRAIPQTEWVARFYGSPTRRRTMKIENA